MYLINVYTDQCVWQSKHLCISKLYNLFENLEIRLEISNVEFIGNDMFHMVGFQLILFNSINGIVQFAAGLVMWSQPQPVME